MVFKGLVTAASAVALMVAPTMAAAQTSAAVSTAASVEPAGESVNGSELRGRRGGFIIPLIAIILIILGILALIGDDDNEAPESP